MEEERGKIAGARGGGRWGGGLVGERQADRAGGGSTALESGGGEGARGQLAGSIIHGPRDIFAA